jgi:CspA family cold shock protein
VASVVIEKDGGARVTGTVKRLAADRGFGFITAEDGSDYFFHRSAVDSSLVFEDLAIGGQVSFDVERSERGPRAGHVRAA